MFNKSNILSSTLFVISTIGMAGISAACEIPEGWQVMKTDTPGISKAAIKIPADTNLLGGPFDLEFMTCDEKSGTINEVKVDATMPHHNHGMNYVPQVTTTGANRYKATGMVFHMPGKWHVTLETHGTDKTIRYVLELPVK